MNHVPREHHEVEIEVTYLEMHSPDQLCASRRTELVVTQAEVPSPELSRFLYTAVGGNWFWTDRLSWSYERWQAYLENPQLTTWVGYVRGTPAGYFELLQEASDVEIKSFGLLPQFIGQGLGGDLLTRSVQIAWSLKPARVWLHTCTLDSPAGLQNYVARGFEIFDRRTKREQQPMEPPGPW
jgi:ribosomal protein S18 acetylase RimI-like enzyme